MLSIIYQDSDVVAINKPHGLVVHRSRLAGDAREFALQMLRNQLNHPVFPAHRIDRKTGGALLFALNKDVLPNLQTQFMESKIDKRYVAVVRGYADERGVIDYPLRNDRGRLQEALTKYKTLARAELNVPFGKHTTSRYSLVEVQPQSGRYHQIRKHFSHINHPIIGDRPHGCNKQNRLFKERWQMNTMLLHAASLSFLQPGTEEQIVVKAPFQSEFQRMLDLMNWQHTEEIQAFVPS